MPRSVAVDDPALGGFAAGPGSGERLAVRAIRGLLDASPKTTGLLDFFPIGLRKLIANLNVCSKIRDSSSVCGSSCVFIPSW